MEDGDVGSVECGVWSVESGRARARAGVEEFGRDFEFLGGRMVVGREE